MYFLYNFPILPSNWDKIYLMLETSNLYIFVYLNKSQNYETYKILCHYYQLAQNLTKNNMKLESGKPKTTRLWAKGWEFKRTSCHKLHKFIWNSKKGFFPSLCIFYHINTKSFFIKGKRQQLLWSINYGKFENFS